MGKYSVARIVIINTLICLASNLVHPVEPVMFLALGLPDYTFGLAFSMMSITIFLTSPFWGRMSDRFGCVKVITITMLIYSVTQLLFGLSRTLWHIVVIRALAGCVAGGMLIAALAYITQISPDEKKRGRNIAIFIAMQTAGTSLGFLVGGIVGNNNYRAAFYLQFASLAAIGIASPFLLKELKIETEPGSKKASLNPFIALIDSRKILTPSLAVFMLIALLTSFGYQSHDNTFNYYLRQVLNFEPQANGLFKALTTIVGLALNFSLNIFLAAKTNIRRSIGWAFLGCGLSIIISVYMPAPLLVVGVNLLFYAFYAIYQPLQQTLLSLDLGRGTVGEVVGLFNAAKAIGMIIGPLLAGFFYARYSRLTFVCIGAVFVLSAILSYVNAKQYHKA